MRKVFPIISCWHHRLSAVFLITASVALASDPGDLVIRDVLPLNAAERRTLRQLLESSEEARELLKEKQDRLASLPQLPPRPLREMVYEGRLNTDPARIATVEHLQDMDRTAAWLEVWQATNDPALARSLQVMIVAWSGTYLPTGNDVNEGKLVPLLVAYEALRADFPAEERARVDEWVRALASPHFIVIRKHSLATGNRYAKRLRLVALAGLILGESQWKEAAEAGLRALVERALYAGGTSHDLHERDTLTYHTTTLRPLLDIALLARRNDRNLYEWEASSGGSIKRSVDYVRPYASGEKTREEWKNSRVELDRRRAAAGIAHYHAGSLYEPRQALPLLEAAELFDPSLGALVAALSNQHERRFPTWRTVLNAALRQPSGF